MGQKKEISQRIKPRGKLTGILSKKRLHDKVKPITQEEIDKAKIEFNERRKKDDN